MVKVILRIHSSGAFLASPVVLLIFYQCGFGPFRQNKLFEDVILWSDNLLLAFSIIYYYYWHYFFLHFLDLVINQFINGCTHKFQIHRFVMCNLTNVLSVQFS